MNTYIKAIIIGILFSCASLSIDMYGFAFSGNNAKSTGGIGSSTIKDFFSKLGIGQEGVSIPWFWTCFLTYGICDLFFHAYHKGYVLREKKAVNGKSYLKVEARKSNNILDFVISFGIPGLIRAGCAWFLIDIVTDGDILKKSKTIPAKWLALILPTILSVLYAKDIKIQNLGRCASESTNMVLPQDPNEEKNKVRNAASAAFGQAKTWGRQILSFFG
ncbi:MAG TPA: hypothetical protein VEK38_02490 [Candidatus Bathyarchaeia archaeon]|nr:hypothetical protein [Candidatus Bathyarchaeia archaeon]